MGSLTVTKVNSIKFRRCLLGDAVGIPTKQPISALWGVDQIPELILSSNGQAWTVYSNKPSQQNSPASLISIALHGQQFALRHDALQAVSTARLFVA